MRSHLATTYSTFFPYLSHYLYFLLLSQQLSSIPALNGPLKIRPNIYSGVLFEKEPDPDINSDADSDNLLPETFAEKNSRALRNSKIKMLSRLCERQTKEKGKDDVIVMNVHDTSKTHERALAQSLSEEKSLHDNIEHAQISKKNILDNISEKASIVNDCTINSKNPERVTDRDVLESKVLNPFETLFDVLYSTAHCRLIKKWNGTEYRTRGKVKESKSSNNDNERPSSLLSRSATPKVCTPLHSSETYSATESVFLQWALGMSPASYLSSFSPWTSPNGRVTVEVLCVDPCVGDLKECVRTFHAESSLTAHPNMSAKRYVKSKRGVRAVSTSGSTNNADDRVQDRMAGRPDRHLNNECVRIVIMLGGRDKIHSDSVIRESSGSASPFYRPENPLFDSNILERGLGSVFRGDMGMAYDFQVGVFYTTILSDSLGDRITYILYA